MASGWMLNKSTGVLQEAWRSGKCEENFIVISLMPGVPSVYVHQPTQTLNSSVRQHYSLLKMGI